jgi:hypothetical protein
VFSPLAPSDSHSWRFATTFAESRPSRRHPEFWAVDMRNQ